MFPGLVFGIDLTGAGLGTQWLLVTGIYPGMTSDAKGYVTVYNLTGDGSLQAPNWIGGSKTTVYTGGTLKARPYRLKVISGQPRYTNASTVALSGEEILGDTTGGVITITLPQTPQIQDKIIIRDAAGTWATHNLTIARNGNKINSASSDLTENVNNTTVTLIYINSTIGWKTY
jgi:hypothetical protein